MTIRDFDFENATDEDIEALGGLPCNGGLDPFPDEDEIWRYDSA
jgi:hypothetical protein